MALAFAVAFAFSCLSHKYLSNAQSSSKKSLCHGQRAGAAAADIFVGSLGFKPASATCCHHTYLFVVVVVVVVLQLAVRVVGGGEGVEVGLAQHTSKSKRKSFSTLCACILYLSDTLQLEQLLLLLSFFFSSASPYSIANYFFFLCKLFRFHLNDTERQEITLISFQKFSSICHFAFCLGNSFFQLLRLPHTDANIHTHTLEIFAYH